MFFSTQISLTSHTKTIQEVAFQDAQEVSEEVPLQIKVTSPVSQKIKEEQTLTRLKPSTSKPAYSPSSLFYFFCAVLYKRLTDWLAAEDLCPDVNV